MPTTFHGFPKLPPELRLKIWELAARPYQPGAHFFSFARLKDVPGGNEGTVHDIDLWAADDFAAPIFATDCSLLKDNPSTYLRDVGLWTASRDSRFVMETRFDTSRWRKKISGTSPDPIEPCFGRFRRDHKVWRLAIYPERDLFCFRRLSPSCLGTIYYLISLSTWVTHYGIPRDIRNMAFEFEATWAFDPGATNATKLLTNCDQRAFFLEALDDLLWGPYRLNARMFLIDYGLRLKPGVSPRQTFYGEGCTFVDHDKDDVDWERTVGRSAWDFLNSLDILATRGLRWNHHGVTPSTQVSILACERG
ncbi:hypothetical protein CMUS01_13578 [Colletotrichum musicola]|uniref:2EXR domain-containing protein n=1 Tax=Colletotrichum musicola TaxID=2175873 RepID=A0A8H6MUZ1_9PEZI|nr:hypothetical protein CMUS01_13578 [Colletotrichum musicola]